ncbi:unnamed protein product [Acanthoscelides obtectus]|uniref:Fatty acyl-CoA reductase n=1 Tax=Acanthoscelides obtectus TaxID=200917 RepID=A0A9P0PEZ7_ACAOB|nr:unnamed protein product [Acanthoscelides obtectus]CAK1676159.1 Fatty acyl-CoA reductase 1 [Acanthoscelides obtectus]
MTGNDESRTIPGYFKGKNVLITGGTGFVGLVLIEKLLRSCPEIRNIYLLMRHRRNKSPEDRLKELVQQQLFDSVRKINPEVFNKLKPVSGDIAEVGLGLSEKDETVLISDTNIIYHVAASVRFNDHFQDAVKMNLRSTVEVLNLALKCENLEVYVHTSTAYCNSDVDGRIEEKVYRPSLDWRDALEMVDNGDKDVIETLTMKMIHPLKNTYTYTKRLAEQAVVDICKDRINAVILRPSIVMSTVHEPVSGWSNNLNGPFSLSVAGVMGISSTFFFSVKSELDVVYVDNVAKSLIIATREKYINNDKSEVEVYNATSELMWKVANFESTYTLSRELVHFEDTLWYYNVKMTHCFFLFYFWTMFHISKTQSGNLQRSTCRTFLRLQQVRLCERQLRHARLETLRVR